MGKRIREKECALPSRNCSSSHHTHQGRVWGILHVIKYHHWRPVKRRITNRRHGGGRPDESKSQLYPLKPNIYYHKVEDKIYQTITHDTTKEKKE